MKSRIVGFGEPPSEEGRDPDYSHSRTPWEERVSSAFNERFRDAVGMLEKGLPPDMVLAKHGRIVLREAELVLKRHGAWKKGAR